MPKLIIAALALVALLACPKEEPVALPPGQAAAPVAPPSRPVQAESQPLRILSAEEQRAAFEITEANVAEKAKELEAELTRDLAAARQLASAKR